MQKKKKKKVFFAGDYLQSITNVILKYSSYYYCLLRSKNQQTKVEKDFLPTHAFRLYLATVPPSFFLISLLISLTFIILTTPSPITC